MNYMEQVAKMLGLELGEEFQIRDYENESFRIQHNGLVDDVHRLRDTLFLKLLCGSVFVKKIYWKPKEGNKYYYLTSKGEVVGEIWGGVIKDIFNYKTGNCFKTKEEITPEIIKKYTDFFNDDERMIDI